MQDAVEINVTSSGGESESGGSPSEETTLKKDDGEKRMSWGGRAEFLLSCISLAVGLGNVWRFNYLVQKNGGGTFLLPYLLMLVLEGIPIYFLEICIGQRMQKGVVGTWSTINPVLGGIGLAACITSFLVDIYYNVIIAWALFYLFSSFQADVPWGRCPGYAYDSPEALESCKNATSQFFWYNEALDASTGIGDAGVVNWKLFLCLLFAWILVFLFMFKGVKSIGKVVYFTTLYPYFVLTILFFRGVTLPGASIGLKHLFQPDWSKLYSAEVWLEAATQIFFSLGMGFGGIIAYSSYNGKSRSALRDTLIISLVNSGTSIYAAIVVFSVLGHQSKVTGLKLSEIGGGPGLAFIAFGEGLTLLAPSTLWSILFFLMLLSLGMGSMFGGMESVLASMGDIRPFKRWRREVNITLVCVVSFLVGISMVTQGGQYVIELFDHFCGTLPLLIVAFFECFIVVHIYGLERFCHDIEDLTGRQPALYFKICWKYVSPAIMVIITIGSVVFEIIDPPTYTAYVDYGEVSKAFPVWATFIGTILLLFSVLAMPGVAFYKRPPDWRQQLSQFFRSLFRCTRTWSPQDSALEADSANQKYSTLN